MKKAYAILCAIIVAVLIGHLTVKDAKAQGGGEYTVGPPWGRLLLPENRFVAVLGGEGVWDLETDLVWQKT